MKLSIGKKLCLSFGAIIALMALNAVIVYVNIGAMRENVREVVDRATPTVRACDRLQNGVNQSLAAVRGYLILGEDEEQARYFRAERADAWQDIDDSLQQLQKYSDALEMDNRRRVDQIVNLVGEMRTAQQAAEDIGQTAENVPCGVLFNEQLRPHAQQILDTLTAIIAANEDLEASPQRHQLQKTLADARGSFATALALLQSYRFTGDAADWNDAEETLQKFDSVLESVSPVSADFSPEQQQLWVGLQAKHTEFDRTAAKLHALRSGEDWNKAEYILARQAAPAARSLKGALDELTLAVVQQRTHLRQEIDASISVVTTVLIVASLAAVLLATIVALMLSRHLVSMVRALGAQAEAIAVGDLRGNGLTTKSSDELGQLAEGFNTMLANLKDLTGQVLSVTQNVNSAATQISSSASQQACSTKQQASTVQEITSTMREISRTGAQILDKAKELSTAAEASTQASQSGITAVQETSRTMEAIREQVEEVAQNIVALSEKTQAIGDIVATVNEVAEQSNLLALNATIEAASAGEQGNRFSVVADEMKNLADQAKQCTVQVRDILSEIQKGINSSVMLTEEAVKRVESGKQRTQVTEETIRQMSRTTDDSVQAFQQIIGATNQQQIGFEQVAQGMEEIREAAQQTASGTSQLELAVSSLSALSKQLKTAVGSYQV